MFLDIGNIMDFKDDKELFNVKEGFILGNMFKDEYDAYKGYIPSTLHANNEKDKILLCIYEYDFALNDLNLYLDLNPNNKKMYDLFKKLNEERKYYVDLYESRYGPLELDNSDYNSYEWIKGPWPFEGVDINV